MANISENALLKRPLYVFDLPEELLFTLQFRSDVNTASASTSTSNGRSSGGDTSPSKASDVAETEISNATSCGLCGLSFESVLDQRSHIRSDLHGYNLKQKLRGGKPVDEQEFERLVGNLDESLSGSESSYSGSDADDEIAAPKKETTLTALLKKQATLADEGDEEIAPARRRRGAGTPPLVWFSSTKLPSNISLGFYRTLFTAEEQNADGASLVQTIQRKQLKPGQPKQTRRTDDEDDNDSGGVKLPPSMRQPRIDGPLYFLCMIGGGHFAAMVISLTPSVTRKAGVEDRSATVVAHKTFHRYTTRRKQGGAQSSNDNSKGNAHSAGAALRRYNEAALMTDVRSLLGEWKHWITAAELLFIRATGTTNRRTLFDKYDGQVLSSQDPRIRGFPFSTRRATQTELMRCFVELTRVKVSDTDELALERKAAEDAARAETESGTPKPPASPKAPKPKVSKEEEEALLHTSQLQSLIRRSKAPGLVSYIASSNIAPDFRFVPEDKPENHHAPTPLHLAASLNSPACVSALLLKAKSDPTIRNDDGKSAAELAGDRATRDAFRLARSTLGDDVFDWDSAGVGSPLTKAEVDSRAAQERAEADSEAALERERRRAELERLREEDREKEELGRERKFGKGKSLLEAGNRHMSAEERRAEEARGLTPEMRMKLERERRARAAEARFAKK